MYGGLPVHFAEQLLGPPPLGLVGRVEQPPPPRAGALLVAPSQIEATGVADQRAVRRVDPRSTHEPVERLVDTPAKLQLLIVFASLLIIVCIVTVILMCRHKAHQNNQSLLFDFNTKRLLWNFFLPLVVGGILCISLIWQSHYGLTSSIMLIFYGVALISASNYTFSNTRYLGYAEIALGLADSFVENYALLFWFVGFGLFHIVYGIFFHLKYEKKNK